MPYVGDAGSVIRLSSAAVASCLVLPAVLTFTGLDLLSGAADGTGTAPAEAGATAAAARLYGHTDTRISKPPTASAGQGGSAAGQPGERQDGSLHIASLTRYVDPFYSFEVAVPSGWQRIVSLDETTQPFDGLEAGYVLGFESPRSAVDDRYADYVMIEILPGQEAAAFQSSGQERSAVVIDGRPAMRDRILLDAVPMPDASLSLVVYQATMRGLGFQVGLYAVGEQHEARAMELAFDALLTTFTLREAPYEVF